MTDAENAITHVNNEKKNNMATEKVSQIAQQVSVLFDGNKQISHCKGCKIVILRKV